MGRIVKSRTQSALHSTRIPLLASTLSDMLDERKSVTSRKELERLAAKYKIEVAELESLSRFVNSPSIGEGTTVRKIQNGEENVTMTVSAPRVFQDGDSMYLVWIQGCMDRAIHDERTPFSDIASRH